MSAKAVATIAAIDAAAPDWFAPLERHLARVLGDLVGEADEQVRLALALACRQVSHGHVCLDVPATAASGGPVDERGEPLADLAWPAAGPWLDALASSRLVWVVPDGAPLGDVAPEPRPLVLELPSGRLTVRRWWEHEAVLAADLARRASVEREHDRGELQEGLDRLFPPVEGAADAGRRDQAEAAARVVRRALCVITGGPGTGKTTAVVRVLALLVEQALAAGAEPPRILLLAPTGKAAARLEEAVAGARDRLAVVPEVLAAIPADGRTIHRALRPRHDGTWRHDASNPLPADVVVLDEASMVDVALMRALVEAVRPDARLVVLGDRNQLASVDAGAVLADLCGPLEGGPADVPIAACLATLRHSFRFGPQTGIGALARAVLAGDAERALALLDDPAVPDVSLHRERPTDRFGRLHPDLAERVAAGYGAYLDALGDASGGLAAGSPSGGLGDGTPAADGTMARALAELGRFRVLCGHRRGPSGVGTLGRAVVEELTRLGRVTPIGDQWHGRPVIVTRNDYGIDLFNGDVGLMAHEPIGSGGGGLVDEGLHDRVQERDGGGPAPTRGARHPGEPGRLRAFFPGSGGRPRAVSPARLPPHETVYAMSIHKSQGSEFDAVAVVLPEDGSPLLTRELLYTAVTRARRSVTVYGTESALRSAMARRAERASGLGARLWGP